MKEPVMEAASLLAAIVESSSDAIVGKSLDGSVLSWNAAAERIFGHTAAEMLGRSIREIIPPERQAEEEAIIASIGRGERVPSFDTVRLRKDGSEVHVAVTVSPVHDAAGNVIAASKIARDITQRLEAERRIELLMLEVNHRSKNMLAMIQSLARHSANQTGRSSADFVARLERRIASLAANQDLLVRRAWADVPLGELVAVQLAFLGEGLAQVDVAGPVVLLTPGAAETIGMALHELATNAVKYGALTAGQGRVVLTWERIAAGDPIGGGGLAMHWREHGGPPVGMPEQRGFGSRLIADVPRGKLGAHVAVDYAPAGLTWTLRSGPAGVLA